MLRAISKRIFRAVDWLWPTPSGPRVLIYHQVGPDNGRQMEVTVEQFEYQVASLAKGWDVVPLEEALSRWDEPGSHRLAVVTFDDGYEDTFQIAYPILRDSGLPFTLYVSSSHVESSTSRYPGLAASPLTWRMIETMVDSGLLTLGSHTHSHADLRQLGPDEIERELTVCDDLISQRVGVEPRHFAYPYGYWSPTADKLVRERYESAALGAVHSARPGSDPYLMHRYPIQLSDGTRHFDARLRGGFLLEERVRRRLRGYRGP